MSDVNSIMPTTTCPSGEEKPVGSPEKSMSTRLRPGGGGAAEGGRRAGPALRHAVDLPRRRGEGERPQGLQPRCGVDLTGIGRDAEFLCRHILARASESPMLVSR